jgi:hypothetical protein
VRSDEPVEAPLRRRISWTAAVLLGGGAVLIVALLLRQDAAAPSYVGVASLDPSTWSEHVDPEFGWLVRTPPGGTSSSDRRATAAGRRSWS